MSGFVLRHRKRRIFWSPGGGDPVSLVGDAAFFRTRKAADNALAQAGKSWFVSPITYAS